MALIPKKDDKVYGGAVPPAPVDPYANNQLQDKGRYSYGAIALQNLPGQGSGRDFTAYRQGQAVDVLGSGITQSEGDYGNREALRQAIGKEIGNYGGYADTRERNFLNNQERQLSRNAAQLRRQMGGTGLSGTSQGRRGLGEILAASQRETGQGLNQMQLQKGQELGQFAQINQSNLAQSLAERGYTLQQANTLASLLQQQAGLEQGSLLATREQPGPSDLERGLGYALGGLGAVAGGAGNLGWKPFG